MTTTSPAPIVDPITLAAWFFPPHRWAFTVEFYVHFYTEMVYFPRALKRSPCELDGICRVSVSADLNKLDPWRCLKYWKRQKYGMRRGRSFQSYLARFAVLEVLVYPDAVIDPSWPKMGPALTAPTRCSGEHSKGQTPCVLVYKRSWSGHRSLNMSWQKRHRFDIF